MGACAAESAACLGPALAVAPAAAEAARRRAAEPDDRLRACIHRVESLFTGDDLPYVQPTHMEELNNTPMSFRHSTIERADTTARGVEGSLREGMRRGLELS